MLNIVTASFLIPFKNTSGLTLHIGFNHLLNRQGTGVKT